MSPKLNKETAKQVGAAESTDFEALPPGVYNVKLRSVEVKDGREAAYWTWEFEVLEGEENAGRRFWHTTSLIDKDFPRAKLNETFQAFSATPDTDTDELCGKSVRILVGTRTIPEGVNRAGELSNTVEKVMPFEEAETADTPF